MIAVAKTGDQVDRYILESVLGHGGMATVYLARHVELRSTHAVKILNLTSEPLRARALIEARSQAAIRHPNVVAVTDLLRMPDGAPALVMELIDGPSLAALLKRGPLPIEIADGIAVGILRGLSAAHNTGLIHRDLKPSNVLLELRQGYAVAKIADFGLVKAAAVERRQGPATRSGALLGTPGSMAPEQARDPREVDHRADLFSVGTILYHMVTGEAPYPTDDAIEAYLRALEGRRAPALSLRPDLPPRWVETINAALDPDPSMRPESAEAMLRSLLSDGEASATVELASWSDELLDAARSLRPSVHGPPDDEGPAVSISAPSLAPTLAPTPASAPAPAPAPPRRGLGEGVWQFATALALLASVVVLLTREDTTPPAEELREVKPAPASAAPPPEPAAAAPVELTARTPRAPAPSPAAPSPAAPRPDPPQEPPAAAPPASPAPSVVVEGPVRVILEGGDGKIYTAGAVPSGDYTVYAYFDGTIPTQVLTVTVAEDAPLRLVCNPALKVCVRR